MVNLRLTVRQVAEAFCELSDDEQTRFFGAVADAMRPWLPHQRQTQLVAIGRHLVDCACGGADAREVVSAIYESMQEALRLQAQTQAQPSLSEPPRIDVEGSR